MRTYLFLLLFNMAEQQGIVGTASSPVARDHWGVFELIALYACSHHPSLALLRAREFPNPHLAAEKACGGGSCRKEFFCRRFALRRVETLL